jgi:hypothetical protein
MTFEAVGEFVTVFQSASAHDPNKSQDSSGRFPAKIYGVIAEHLIFHSAFGTCANLDIASKSTHFHVKPVLWRIILVKTEENATPFWGDKPEREAMLRAGKEYIRYAERNRPTSRPSG